MPAASAPLSLSLSSSDVIGPETFAEHGYPHEVWRVLRRESPIHWFDLSGGDGFWAVTRHADIVAISKQPDVFRSGPRMAVFDRGGPIAGERDVRHLITMDPPEHGHYRKAVSPWFSASAVQQRRPTVERLTCELLDAMAGDGGERESDFVEDLAAPLTLSVLADMFGVPRADWRRMFAWTNQLTGAQDPEFQVDDPRRGWFRRAQPQGRAATLEHARRHLFAYFSGLAEERRRAPGDDVVSMLANANIDGRPIPDRELLSNCMLLVVAGNETTRAAAARGLLALIEHPEQLRLLREQPNLVETAVEEIIRWTSPIAQFCRTPVRPVEVRGQRIRAGQTLCLLYPSANRDEAVFDDPDTFRIDRRPNPHLAFGVGPHFCLGAHLARLELCSIFTQLARRLESIELAGPIERVRSNLVGGVKRMPIRYRLRPGRAGTGSHSF